VGDLGVTASDVQLVREALGPEPRELTGITADPWSALDRLEARIEEQQTEDWNWRQAVARAEAAEARVRELEAALREGGCQFYLDGGIGACQEFGETNPCAACAALKQGEEV